MKIAPFSPPPCIVVPVYNAPHETNRCLHSIIRETHPPYRLLVLDDASTDATVAPMLRALQHTYAVIELHRHEKNLGFAANVNYGMAETDGDVVLLNSDTIVSSGWLDKLIASAYSRTDVATVTPVSNAAGAFSVPDNNRNNPIPDGWSINEVAAQVARAAAPNPTVAPTGNGFCLYIRRKALEQLGFFDAEAFPYVGEENDFGQRAQLFGFVNLVDSSCYVYHVRGASFKEDKSDKLAAARALIDQRYPDYKDQVTAFLNDPDLRACRSRLRIALADPLPVRPKGRHRILSVIHAGGGGMVHTNRDLMHGLSHTFDTYELRCDLKEWHVVRVENDESVAHWQFGTPWRSTDAPDVSRRMALRSLVEVLQIDLVHIRTLIGTGPEILSSLSKAGVQIVLSLHDFATVCPTIQLVDEQGVFCGGHCTPSRGDCHLSVRWFPDVRNLKHNGVYRWRERMAANLGLADAFVTTAESAKQLLVEHFPALSERRFLVIEHGRDPSPLGSAAAPPASPLKVVAFGALGLSKGTRLMEIMFKANARSGGPVEFHLLGGLPGHFRVDYPHVFCHGSYERDALPFHLREIAPSYALICSVWPETYCHTLTEAWMSGIPVLASDIGVLAERVKRHGGGRLLDPQRPELWFDALQELRSPTVWQSLSSQARATRFPTVADMSEEYGTLYRELLQ